MNTDIKRVLYKTDRLINNVKNDTSLSKTDQHYNNYRKLVRILRYDDNFLALDKTDQIITVQRIINKHKLLYHSSVLAGSIINAVVNESKIITENNFWKINYNLIVKWFDDTITRKLPYRKSYLYLSILLILYKNKDMIKSDQLVCSLISQCIKLTGFSYATVVCWLKEFLSNDVINITKLLGGKYIITVPDWFNKIETVTAASRFDTTRDHWEDPIFDAELTDKNDLINYTWLLPYNNYNTLISYVEPNFIIHSYAITINVILFSILDKHQLESVHRIWLKRQFKRGINQKYIRAKSHLAKIPTIKNIKCDDAHYEQIRLSYPILNFIARRNRRVNIELLLDQRSTYAIRKKTLRHRLSETAKILKIDDRYFLKCLDSNDFFNHWSKKYNIETLNPFAGPSVGIPDVLAEKVSAGVDKMIIPNIQKYRDLAKLEAELTKIWNYIIKNNSNNLTTHYNCLEIKTHRITFKDYPIQNITKDNRMIVGAEKGNLFVLVDINSAELEIIKWYIKNRYGIKDKELEGFTFEQISEDLGLSRSTIKSMSYPFIYGAGKDKISLKSNQSSQIVDRFTIKMNSFPGLSEFRNDAVSNAKEDKFSIPTALGHKFPIWYKPETQGLVYTIQGTGAELLREWILELHKESCACYISNIIHDEIIFQIPEKEILDTVDIVNRCFQTALNKILPDSNASVSYHLSKTWSRKHAIAANDIFKVP